MTCLRTVETEQPRMQAASLSVTASMGFMTEPVVPTGHSRVNACPLTRWSPWRRRFPGVGRSSPWTRTILAMSVTVCSLACTGGGPERPLEASVRAYGPPTPPRTRAAARPARVRSLERLRRAYPGFGLRPPLPLRRCGSGDSSRKRGGVPAPAALWVMTLGFEHPSDLAQALALSPEFTSACHGNGLPFLSHQLS